PDFFKDARVRRKFRCVDIFFYASVLANVPFIGMQSLSWKRLRYDLPSWCQQERRLRKFVVRDKNCRPLKDVAQQDLRSSSMGERNMWFLADLERKQLH